MISTTFGYGERESIAGAYAKMYAPKRMNESCDCGKDGCKCESKGKLPVKHKVPSKTGSKLGVRKVMPFDKRDPKPCCAKKVAVKKVGNAEVAKKGALVGGTKEVKHKVPSKTGSKLGVRKVMPFDKRDPKSSAAKYAPKAKKVSESVKHFCISDGERTLCTNDVGESYFNKGGITDETRIYESCIAALKDIKKVNARRKAKDKYKVRGCRKVGESIEFIHAGRPVNEGLFDFVGNVAKGVGNVAGGALKGVGNLVQGNVAQAGKDVLGGLKGAGSSAVNAVFGDGASDKAKEIGATAVNKAKSVGNAVVDGAKTVGTGALNLAKSAGNATGGALKSVGEFSQGNAAEAKNALLQGMSAAKDNIVGSDNAANGGEKSATATATQQTAAAAAPTAAPAATTANTTPTNTATAATTAQTPNTAATTPANTAEQPKQSNDPTANMPDDVKEIYNNTFADNNGNEAEKQRIQSQIEQLQSQLKALG